MCCQIIKVLDIVIVIFMEKSTNNNHYLIHLGFALGKLLRAVSEWGQRGDNSHLGWTIVRIPKWITVYLNSARCDTFLLRCAQSMWAEPILNLTHAPV